MMELWRDFNRLYCFGVWFLRFIFGVLLNVF